MLGTIDCQAQVIGSAGYAALAAPGSSVALALTGMLTLFVAFFGYRMLLGETLGAREGVLAVIKIGVVMTLATSWPTFRTLAYDVVLRGPSELAATIGAPAGLPGSGGGLIGRLQFVDDQLVELVQLGTGRPDYTEIVVGATRPLSAEEQVKEQERLRQAQKRPRWDPAEDAKRVVQARTFFLTGTIAAFAAVRLLAGLLLALGPFFALFLLFENTRGLFEGWIRGLGGAALGGLATSIVLGVELALIEPWLANILVLRRADVATATVPVELVVVTLVFALTLLAVLVATARVAYGFRFAPAWQRASARLATVFQPAPAVAPSQRSETFNAADDRSRALAVAGAVAATQRREANVPVQPSFTASGAPTRQPVVRTTATPTVIPLGQNSRRRTRGRVSAGAGRRDMTA
jgi:type IV secretion system protein VirB6